MARRTRHRIALVAHDNKKADLIEWAQFNRGSLSRHDLVATGTTGLLLHEQVGLDVKRMQSGPLGGDMQIGALITEGDIDLLIFFWDPLEPQPHDPDVRALLRIAVVYNTPTACNRATADFLISSPMFLEVDAPLAEA
jgi:methylglyoxal synthase